MKPTRKIVKAPWIAALSIAAVTTLSAGINEWTSLGPQGGRIVMLTVDPWNPGTVYAASQGVSLGGWIQGASFKTSDGGMHWTRTNFPVGRAVPDPQDSDTLYVATRGHGIFKSTDAGATWTPVNTGPQNGNFVSSLLINPLNPSTLYAGIASCTPACSSSQVVKSVDGGETWNLANSGLPPASLGGGYLEYSLAMDPQDADTLYAGVIYGGLYKTTDGGESWAQVSAIDSVAAGTVIVDPGDSRTLYAWACKGSDSDSCTWTVLKSVDQGESWSEANSGLPETARWLVMDPQDSRTLYAGACSRDSCGVFKTTDGAASWNPVSPDLRADILAIDPQNHGTLYAGTAGGILKSTDGGISWSRINSGLTATNISVLAIDPGSTLYAMEGLPAGALWNSADGGANWTAQPMPMPLRSLTIDPLTPGTIYGIAANDAGILKSTDGGASWRAVNSGLPDHGVAVAVSVAVDPRIPGTAYSSTKSIKVYLTDGAGIFKTTDGAATWHALGPGPTAGNNTPVPANTLAIDPLDPGTIYAVSNGIWKSTDGGVNFVPANSGLPTYNYGGTVGVNAFVMDPQYPGTLYVWTANKFGQTLSSGVPLVGGLFKTTNGGAVWQEVTPGLPDGIEVNSFAIDSGGTIYATTLSGVLRSTDGGSNWSAMNFGLDMGVNVLAFDPRNAGTLYAGTPGAGVFAITTASSSTSEAAIDIQ